MPTVKRYTTKGRVIARPRWLRPDEIAVANPQHLDGISVINLNRVVDLRDQNGVAIPFTLPDVNDRTWTVPGSKDNLYTVTRQAGNFKCTCPGFQFRHNCRHITEVQQ